MKKAEEVHGSLRKSQKLMAIKEHELAEARQEITELERTWSNYEKQVQEKGASWGRDIQLDEDQVSVCQTTPSFPFRQTKSQLILCRRWELVVQPLMFVSCSTYSLNNEKPSAVYVTVYSTLHTYTVYSTSMYVCGIFFSKSRS